MSEAPVPPLALPAAHVCERARLSRDARFDGLFFTAVLTTGIYCRPVCPARTARRDNVRYFANAAAAEAAGYRPCLRCRPELAPAASGQGRGDSTIDRALALIDAGELAGATANALADKVGLGERQLRRLFLQRLGATPQGIHATRRLLFGKQLLTETKLSITAVAMAAGFGSLRRFHAVFRDAYRMAPRDLRRRQQVADPGVLCLRLGYRPPFAFAATLAFLAKRALPGIESVDGKSWARLLTPAETGGSEPGWLRLDAWPGSDHALRLQLHGVLPQSILGLVQRVRRMFDLDAEPAVIASSLRASAKLRPLLRKASGLRIPGAWDGFETAVRAVLGQQVSVAAARTLARRLVERHGRRCAPTGIDGLDCSFPTAAELADADLRGLGITGSRVNTIHAIARAITAGDIGFRAGATLDDFVSMWVALPGIGPWTAHYLAMRVIGHPDAFPGSDLVLRKAAGNGLALTEPQLLEQAEAWRPWRAYAAIQLWHAASTASNKPSDKRKSFRKPR